MAADDLVTKGAKTSADSVLIWFIQNMLVSATEELTLYALKLMSRNTKCILVWLTHWGRVTHKCVGKLTIIGSDNGLSPERRQAIIWTNAGILLIGPLGTNFIEILIEIHTFSLKKMHLKMSFGKWWLFCLGPNVLKPSSWNLHNKKHCCRWPGNARTQGIKKYDIYPVLLEYTGQWNQINGFCVIKLLDGKMSPNNKIF